MTTIHFVRHGYVHNPSAILYGRLPNFRLSAEGQAQAQAAATFLGEKNIAAIYSSPMLRARQTAQIIAKAHPTLSVVRISDNINEIYTSFEGRPLQELEAINWEFYDGVQAPYESPADIFARIMGFVGKVQERHRGQELIAVSHGDICVFATAWAKKVAVSGKFKREMALDNGYPATASITSISFEDVEHVTSFSYTIPYTIS